jgi:hypothetical protein
LGDLGRAATNPSVISAGRPGRDAPVWVVGRARALAPQPEVAPTSLESEAREAGGVVAPAPAVEIRRCGADGDEADVDVEAVADAGYVAEQATVTIDGVGRGFAGESDESPRREQGLRDCRHAFLP